MTGTITAEESINVKSQPKYNEITLSYSEYKNSVWTAKKISKGGLKLKDAEIEKIVTSSTDQEQEDYAYTKTPENQLLIANVSKNGIVIKVIERTTASNFVYKGYFEINNCNGLLNAVNVWDTIPTYISV